MPFTPFHLGPALLFGMLLRKHLHLPTFLISNVILDVEPLLVLILGLRYPLHGYFHTFIIGFLTGFSLSLIMLILERFLATLYKVFLLEHETRPTLIQFLFAGSSGTTLHVLLDSPLYDDIQPLYPSKINPFYNPAFSREIYFLCLVTGVLGFSSYICVFVFPRIRKNKELR